MLQTSPTNMRQSRLFYKDETRLGLLASDCKSSYSGGGAEIGEGLEPGRRSLP